ncbi:hypothetical protein JDV02_000062 [Purpureocillium takamizusanense]|uniref:Uncharacterized protein n=1 Tax=Purpureocillium takamizusanense TaxID=2060973 RepID=A0A9Q8Q597_9HYPO|nr:uncharacterized protein JDV02_000062 [Purpureocillium takamizusanense]UNI13305.1 hypothetical protein JDV02_000062 [Purpureocillium takamizusanense]
MDGESTFVLPRYIIEMESTATFQLLSTLVREPTASVTDVLEQFSHLTSAARSPSNEETPFGALPYNTCCALLEIAKRTAPQAQHKLVSFVTELQKVKLYDQRDGGQMSSEGYLLWTELPALGYTAADEWNAFDVTTASTPSEETRRYENMIALLAQLSTAADVDYAETTVPELDFTFWSLRAFKEAFDQQDSTDAAVRTACMWLIYGSKRLWANIQYGRVFGRRDGEPGVVLTKEMWDSWVEGLRRVKEHCQRPETHDIVDEALASMGRLSAQPFTNGSSN